MSDYKHIYNALDHAMRHLQQAQECCDDAMHLDKEACGTWKKQIKEAEKALKGCYRKVESKHQKSSATQQTKTASATEDAIKKTISASEQRKLRHRAASLNRTTSRLKRIANPNAEIAKANREFLENKPSFILDHDKKKKELFTLQILTNDFKKPLEADISLLDSDVFVYPAGENKELLSTVTFRPIQAGELLEDYFAKLIETVQEEFGGPATWSASEMEKEEELEDDVFENDLDDERNEDNTTKTSSATSRLKQITLKKQASNYNSVKKVKQYKGFVIASAQDENGNDVFVIYTADEWSQGAGNRSEEWEAGNLEEAMDWINSN